MSKISRGFWLATASMISAMQCMPAAAAEADNEAAASDTSHSGDIIVSARKRQESDLKVPVI